MELYIILNVKHVRTTNIVYISSAKLKYSLNGDVSEINKNLRDVYIDPLNFKIWS